MVNKAPFVTSIFQTDPLRNRCKYNSYVGAAIDVNGNPAGVGTYTIDPLYSFFNHSCEDPMMAVYTMTPRKKVYANRDIQKGEEIFVQYNTCGRNTTREDRHKLLHSWVGETVLAKGVGRSETTPGA